MLFRPPPHAPPRAATNPNHDSNPPSPHNSYVIRAGSFVVCTSSAGTTITNTATLTPQSSTGNGSPLTATAAITLQIFGCELPPDVNFQDIQTWGAQTFSWQLTKTATRNAFSVDQNAGSLAVEYTLKATATPTTGSWAVSGAVFVNNVQPGILNIARLQVQLSTGQTAIPTCSLTTAYTSSDGMVWGGANAGGSITTAPFSSTGLPIVTTDTAAALAIGAMGIGTGIFNQFILPEFASATCRFNISLGATNPGSTVTIIPQMNWGFGGMYMLNQPSQLILNFNPPDQFFPVGGCVSVTDVAQAGALQIANGGPNNQQLCVEGRAAPFAQPGVIAYVMTATINPTTTSDCTPGGTKTYTVRCRPCLPACSACLPCCARMPCFACCHARCVVLVVPGCAALGLVPCWAGPGWDALCCAATARGDVLFVLTLTNEYSLNSHLQSRRSPTRRPRRPSAAAARSPRRRRRRSRSPSTARAPRRRR